MLNEQLTCMTPFSHIDQPGLSWRTRARRERRDLLVVNSKLLCDLGVLSGERLFDGVNGWNSTDQR